MEVSLRAPCKTDHFHFTLEKTIQLKAPLREGQIYPHLWSRLRFRVERIISLKTGRTVAILEALPDALDAFKELVSKVRAPVPIRAEDRETASNVNGWSLLPGSQGPDPFTCDEWEHLKIWM